MVGQMEAEYEVVAYLIICGNISRNFSPFEPELHWNTYSIGPD
jgi:hypothetical protein